MRKLTGFILVRETNIGIPNLVVAVYNSKERGNIVFDLSNRTGKKESTVSIETERLGRRIGSCLTDKEGKFELNSDELQFEGNESRPDLLLTVFAPEDVQDADHPYPHPATPEKRILYISTVPRTDAGAEEAYIIRLLQKQLNKYQIPSSLGSNQGEAESVRLYTALENVWTFRKGLSENVNPHLKKEFERNKAFKDAAREKFKNFSAVPKHLRKLSGFLAKPDDPEALRKKQLDVLSEGLERLEKYQSWFELDVTEEELAFMQVKSESGRILGVDPEKLSALIKEKMGGVDLIRKREIKPPALSAEELLKKYPQPDISNNIIK